MGFEHAEHGEAVELSGVALYAVWFPSWKVGRGRTVSRVLYWRVRPISCAYKATPNDTPRLTAVAYFLRINTSDFPYPEATLKVQGSLRRASVHLSNRQLRRLLG